MPRSVSVNLPDGSIVVYKDVPDGVSRGEVEAAARREAGIKTPLSEDLLKSARAGAVTALTNQLPMLETARQYFTPQGIVQRIVRPQIGQSMERAVEGMRQQANEATGGDYVPQTKAGEYTAAGAQGLTGAVATPGGLGGVTPAITGLISGLAGQAAKDYGMGAVGQTGASMLPSLTIALYRMLRGRSAAEHVAGDVIGRNVPSFDPKDAMKSGSRAIDPEVAARARAQGIDLLPGQTFGPQSPHANLQSSSSAPELQQALRAQAEEARRRAAGFVERFGGQAPEADMTQRAVAGAQSVLERRKGAVKELTGPLYEQAGHTPMPPSTTAAIVQGLEQLKPANELAAKGARAPIVDRTVQALTQEGRVKLPAVTKTRRTLTAGSDGPVKGTVTRTVSPERKIDLPVETFGKAKDIRDMVRDSWSDLADYRDPIRAQVMERITAGLHTNPKMKAADEAFGAMQDRLVNPITEPAKVGLPDNPRALLNRSAGASSGVIDQAFDPKRFRGGDINLSISEAGPDFARQLLARRLAQAQDKAAMATKGSPGAAFAQELGAKGSADRGLTMSLVGRTAGPEATREARALLEALNRTGYGRGGEGKVPTLTGTGRDTTTSLMARAGGTNAALAFAPWLGRRLEAREQAKLGAALADATGVKLQALLDANPEIRAAMHALRAANVPNVQGLQIDTATQ